MTIVGTTPSQILSLPHNGEGLRVAREHFGDGSELYMAIRRQVIGSHVSAITGKPHYQWMIRVRRMYETEPDIAAEVDRAVREEAARVVMAAIAGSLDEAFPGWADPLPDCSTWVEECYGWDQWSTS